MKPKAPGLLSSLITSPRTFRSSAVPSWAAPLFTQQKMAKLQFTCKIILCWGSRPCGQFFAGLFFFSLPSKCSEVQHGNKPQCKQELDPCALATVQGANFHCDLVKCGYALTVSFSKSVVLPACYQVSLLVSKR